MEETIDVPTKVRGRKGRQMSVELPNTIGIFYPEPKSVSPTFYRNRCTDTFPSSIPTGISVTRTHFPGSSWTGRFPWTETPTWTVFGLGEVMYRDVRFKSPLSCLPFRGISTRLGESWNTFLVSILKTKTLNDLLFYMETDLVSTTV